MTDSVIQDLNGGVNSQFITGSVLPCVLDPLGVPQDAPITMKQLLSGGIFTNVNSAATIDLSVRDTVNIVINGTTNISTIVSEAAGVEYFIVANAEFSLLSGASLSLPNNDDIDARVGDVFKIKSDGTKWLVQYVPFSGLSVTPNQSAFIVDEKPQNTDGGSCINGVQTRDLNTIRHNDIAGLSLSANLVTVPEGVYNMYACAPAVEANQHQLSLRNFNNGDIIAVGESAYENNAAFSATRSSVFVNKWINTSPVQIQLRHFTGANIGTRGLGRRVNGGNPEVYATLYIERVRLLPTFSGEG